MFRSLLLMIGENSCIISEGAAVHVYTQLFSAVSLGNPAEKGGFVYNLFNRRVGARWLAGFSLVVYVVSDIALLCMGQMYEK